MAFDPNAEPCGECGREVEECICGLSPGLSDHTHLLTEDDDLQFYEWDEPDVEDVEEIDPGDSVGYKEE